MKKMVVLVATSQAEVLIPLCTLQHVSPVWAAVPAPKPRYETKFSYRALAAFAQLASVGSPIGGSPSVGSPSAPRSALSVRSMYHALAPAFAYRATGLLATMMQEVFEATHFSDPGGEHYRQQFLLALDGRGLPLPDVAMQRLAKAMCYTEWTGVPFMWKLSFAPTMPGFPLYMLSVSLLHGVRTVATTPLYTCSDAIHLAISWKLATLLQRHWRQRREKHVVQKHHLRAVYTPDH